jgi:hypothetical protein
MKQRAEIVFEKEETIILRKSSELIESFCPMCKAVVPMATPEAVSLICMVGEREIFRKIDAEKVHFIEGPKVYVCLNSIKVFEEQLNAKGEEHEINK